MSYRNIMVQVDETAGCKTRVDAAVALAARFKSALTGVFLKSNFLAVYGASSALAFVSPESLRFLLDEQAEAVRKAADAARAAFEAVARDAGIAFDWVEIDGDHDEALINCARCHDLTVFPGRAKVSIGEHQIAAGKLGMAAGGPVLVLPNAAIDRPMGRRVLIAWKGSRESARALNDAWPFLREADEVQVLTVRSDGGGTSDPMLERQLRLHGCKVVKIVIDADDDATTAEIIHRHVGTMGADLVVMGLYGHPRFSELVLGGVSQRLLETLPAPLLVSH
jgi:nucleotide-binding universal stress UspA family protein